jgi:hypothetical protein
MNKSFILTKINIYLDENIKLKLIKNRRIIKIIKS